MHKGVLAPAPPAQPALRFPPDASLFLESGIISKFPCGLSSLCLFCFTEITNDF